MRRRRSDSLGEYFNEPDEIYPLEELECLVSLDEGEGDDNRSSFL